ncbi:MAG TPA: AGE family epimerase/isomerase [Acetobacteraceae bacterium]|nr:AGE family epimerase/isomerase [Acetobacteraceae bacterium]
MAAAMPDFHDPAFLRGHMHRLIDFYLPACLDPEGGYFNIFLDDGTLGATATRHLVSTARFVINFSIGARVLARPELIAAAAHGLVALDSLHRDRTHGGFYWVLRDGAPADAAKHCYGHAFVLLAAAEALRAGVPGAKPLLAEAWEILERHFWSPADRLCVDEFDAGFTQSSPYRGQNANMHLTDALIAAFEATGEQHYLDRAEIIAHRICVDLADTVGGLVWEHYRSDWSADLEYNRDDPRNLFRPYGMLPGHLVEWAKLLLLLHRHRPLAWAPARARHFYETACARGADLAFGGLHYSFAPDGTLLDRDKYYWVMSEAIAASAVLATHTGEMRFWQDYDRLWTYSWNHLIDHRHGGWYRVLTEDGTRRETIKSPPGKTDYHPFCACHTVLRLLTEHAP